MKKGDPVRALKPKQPAMAKVDEPRSGSDRMIFLGRIAEMTGHAPSVLLDKLGATRAMELEKRRVFHHNKKI